MDNEDPGLNPELQLTTRKFEEGPEDEELSPGVSLASRYLIEQVIGVGGMGSVYRARDLHFPSITKLVAVKEMSSQVRDPNLRAVGIQNFEREANIIATLSHASIPKIYDFFIRGENAYLVLEYIFGKDLEAILNEVPEFLPDDQVIDWSIELCEVLKYLHNHKPEPIIFRDIKPSNIMINQHNHVVLIDFGIAKSFQVGQKGTMMGTEGYSPPEQYRGEASPLVDIYALGATLHHVLTRCDPQHEPPFTFSERPIRKLNPAVSVQLEAIVNTALEYYPRDRWQSADEMLQALRQVGKSAKTSSKELTAAAQLFVPSKAPDHLRASRAAWTFTCEDEVRGSPAYNDGIIYVGSLDNNIYALDAISGMFLWKYPTGGAIVGRPAIRDRMIYFGSEDTSLHVISTGQGRPVWNCRTGAYVRSSPCVTENYVFFGSDDGFLHAVNVSSGRRLWRFQVGSPIRSTPWFENNLIYFGAESGDFYCLDLFGEPKWHFHAKRAITSSPMVMEDVVYFASMDGNLYAFDAKMGWELWRYRMGKGSISSPSGQGHYVYLGALNNMIMAVDCVNVREAWSFKTEHQVNGSPVIAGDRLYCGSVDGNLYCLEARTGRQIWKFATGKPITGTPLVGDDLVYFGSTDHKVYAVRV